MGIKKTRLLVCKSVYWVNINSNIENHCNIHLEFQQMQPKEKLIHHENTTESIGGARCGHIPAQ